jgi:hypothetical protein
MPLFYSVCRLATLTLVFALLHFALSAQTPSPALSPGTGNAPAAQQGPTKFFVTGQVIDSTDRSGVATATVVLVTVVDSQRVGAQLTDVDGRFGFKNIAPGRYRLIVRQIGYRFYSRGVTVTSASVSVPPIILKPGGLTTSEILIVDRVMPVTMSGDTATFNAAAFKTTKDASAEDLLSKMPGIQVSGGTVTAQGEQVQRVLIDGRPAFDNDPAAALRNLPAEVIDRVSVFDDRTDASRFSGVNDGQRVRTINITTRADKRIGTFGRAYAGGGVQKTEDGVYNGGFSVNRFNGPFRLTLIGQANNINQQNFGIEDILSSQGLGGALGGRGGGGGARFIFQGGGGGGFGGGGGGFGGGGQGGGGGNIGQFLVGQQSGISETQAFGLNLSQQWGTTLAEGKVAKLTGSYFFNRSTNNNLEQTNRSFVQQQLDSTQVYVENSLTETVSNTHRLNLRLEYDTDTLNSFLLTFRGNIQDNGSNQDVNGRTGVLLQSINETRNLLINSSLGYNLNGSALYRRRLGKPGRTVSINVNGGANKGDGDGDLDATNQFFVPVTVTDRYVQISRQRTDGWNAGTQLTYTEPLTKTSQLLTTLSYTYNENDSRREVTDGLITSPSFGQRDASLTNIFFSTTNTYRGELGYNLVKGKHTFTTRLGWGWSELSNRQSFPQAGSLDLKFYNILPTFIYRYAGSQGKSINIVYRVNPSLPSISQLQEVVDNSNPLAPVIGNLSLRQQLQHFLFLRYQGASVQQGAFFSVGIIGQLTEDYIGNSSRFVTTPTSIANGFVLNPGVQLTRPVNLADAYSLRTFITYSKPITKLKSNANFFGSVNYTNNPGLITSRENVTQNNRTHNTSLSGRASLTSNISQNLDFTVASTTAWNNVENDLNVAGTTRYLQQTSTGRVDWRFGKNNDWILQSDVSHTYYDGLTQNFNPNFFLWNAAFGRKLFKDQKGEVKLSVFDLLGQNVSVTRNVTETYVEDVSNVVLQRYVMLTFTWFLRSFKGAPPEQAAPQGMPPGGPIFIRPGQ